MNALILDADYCMHICIFLGGFLNLYQIFTKNLTHSAFFKPLILKALDTKYLDIRYQLPPSLSSLCAASKSRLPSLVLVLYYYFLLAVRPWTCTISHSIINISSVVQDSQNSGYQFFVLRQDNSFYFPTTFTITCMSWMHHVEHIQAAPFAVS